MPKRLQPLIYHFLLEGPKTGYGLAKAIENKTGWKPSWGSIYPALEQLHEEQHLAVKEEGRSKYYSLTKTGKEQAEETSSKRSQAFERMIEQMKILHEIGEDDLSEPIAIMTQMQSGQHPFGAVEKDIKEMKKQFHRLWRENILTKHKKEIKRIVKNATQQFKELK